jgi:hypothetical protein
MDAFGQCKLVAGLQPKDPQLWCKEHPDAIEYHEPTGFRRIPLTTCVGGRALDQESPVHPCAGKEDEFDRAHRASGVAIFLAITVPFVLAGAAGWWVWRNWNGKFGQIRLGDQGNSIFEADQPWVKYPVIALSAVVAVIVAMPVVAGAVWRSVKGVGERLGLGSGSGGGGRGRWSRLGGGTRRFTTRDSFARGSGDYAIVDDDEGELLGEDSDEEV